METLAVLLDKTWDDPVAFYTLVLAVFTFILGASTIGLWVSTAKGIRNQSRDTHILERAYLSVEPGGFGPTYDRGDRVYAKIVIRNVGHLPARNIIWSAKGGSVTPEDNPVDEPTGKGVVLPPGGTMKLVAATIFIESIRKSVSVWGLIRYDDGFGKRRYTRFNHYYQAALPADAADQIPAEGALLAEYGNDAD
jgi:hypothetical protein